MLSAIRALARSPIFGGFIIALLVAAFALFGVQDIFRGANNAAITVGSEQVGVQDLQRAYERQILNIQAQDPRFTREQAEEFRLGDQTVSFLTTQAAIQSKARELGLAVSDQQVIERLEEIDAFRDPFTNQFDTETYLTVLRSNGYTGPRAGQIFEDEMRDELLRLQVLTAILGGVQAPDVLSTSRRAYEQERRSITALLIPASLAGVIETPDDAILAGFVANNPQEFQRPEQRRFTLVRFNPLEYSRDVEIPEEDLQDLYAFKVDNGELADPPTRSISQWIVDGQTEGQAAVEALLAGQAPQDAGLPEEPIVLVDQQAFEIPDQAISDAAFEREAGDIFVLEGRLGWRVVRIDEAANPVLPTFEEARDDLILELNGVQARELMADALARFEDARGGGLDFEEAGAAAQVLVESFDLITASGTTVRGIPAATLQGAPEILNSVFDAPLGFETDPERYGPEGYFTIRVDEIVEAGVPELEEIREDVLSLWTRQQVAERTQDTVNAALARAQDGESLNAISDSLPGTVVEAAVLGRDETAGPFSRQLVGAAFAQSEGTPFQAAASDPTTAVIAVVTDTIVPTGDVFDPLQQATLSEEMSNDITVALQTALTTSYTVQTNQQLVDLALGRIDPNTLQ